MGIRGFILNWAKRITVLGLFSVGVVVAWSYLWPNQDIASLKPANAIVCLGGGVEPSGELHSGTKHRARTCAALYQAGVAPVVIFTGGNSSGGPSAGEGMANIAIDMGLPPSAVIWEGASQSTLQNALYTLPILEQSDNLILVTHAFHLPRSWMSFRWAGATEMTLFAAKENGASGDIAQTSIEYLLREAVAIWFNLGRATLWSVASLMGEPSDDWLY